MKKIELKRKNNFIRFGTETFADFNPQRFITSTVEASEKYLSSQYFIEMALPLHVGSYALIGYVFEPKNSNELIVEVNVSSNKKIFTDTLSFDKDSTYVGINQEYAELILRNIIDYLKLKKVPKGKLRICMGAYSEICSSPWIFNSVSNIIMDIFTYNKILTTAEISEICEKYLQKRYEKYSN